MDPAILLIIVFIVAPLIERLLKAGKGAEQPPEQGPQQRMPQQRPSQPFPNRETQQAQRRQESASAEDDAAAAMLPDDLWEILTGERRPPRLPETQQELEQLEELERAQAADEYADEARSLEEAALEDRSAGEWISPPPPPVVVSHDAYRRPLPEREAPQIVSLEKLTFDPEKRHDRFHEDLEALEGPARVRRPKPNPYRFTSDEDLRRAFVMNEILGTPKGLQ
jgi:hypothetical protein